MRKNREFFKESGELEDTQITEKREEEARLERVEKVKQSEDLRSFLKEVDFRILRNIFERFVEKSQVDSHTLNLIKSDRISSRTGGWGNSIGSYSSTENIIGLDFDRLKTVYDNHQEINIRLAALFALIHEEVHATSKVQFRGLEVSPDYSRHREDRSGYHVSILRRERADPNERPIHEDLYKDFDEAVTEKLALEVFEEYITATGFSTRDAVAKFRDLRTKHPEDISPYEKNLLFLETLIERITHEIWVSHDLVWRAIIRGKYEGEDFQDPELRSAFSDMLGDDFLNMFATGAILKDEFLDRIKIPEAKKSEKAKKVIFKWLKPLLRKVSPRVRYNDS